LERRGRRREKDWTEYGTRLIKKKGRGETLIEDVTILVSVKTMGKDMTFDFLN